MGSWGGKRGRGKKGRKRDEGNREWGQRERTGWRGRGGKREEGEGKAEGRGGEAGSHQSEQAAPEQGSGGSVQRVQQPHPTGGQLGAGCAGGTRTCRVQPRLPLPVPPADRWAGTLWGLSAVGRASLAA